MRKLWRRPLDSQKVKVPVGEVHIIEDRCKGCNFCIEYCPREVLAESTKFNAKGYHPPEVVKPDSCVNCGLCELICPEFAIFSTLREEREANQAGSSGTATPDSGQNTHTTRHGKTGVSGGTKPHLANPGSGGGV